MTITAQEQQKILDLLELYNSTPKETKQKNIIKVLDESGYKTDYIAEQLGISISTIYQWRKNDPIRSNAPSFETALKLAELLKMTITDFIK